VHACGCVAAGVEPGAAGELGVPLHLGEHVRHLPGVELAQQPRQIRRRIADRGRQGEPAHPQHLVDRLDNVALSPSVSGETVQGRQTARRDTRQPASARLNPGNQASGPRGGHRHGPRPAGPSPNWARSGATVLPLGSFPSRNHTYTGGNYVPYPPAGWAATLHSTPPGMWITRRPGRPARHGQGELGGQRSVRGAPAPRRETLRQRHARAAGLHQVDQPQPREHLPGPAHRPLRALRRGRQAVVGGPAAPPGFAVRVAGHRPRHDHHRAPRDVKLPAHPRVRRRHRLHQRHPAGPRPPHRHRRARPRRRPSRRRNPMPVPLNKPCDGSTRSPSIRLGL